MSHECDESCLGHDYIERMERALAGPRFRVPTGLTAEEIMAYIDEVAAHLDTGGCEVVLP